MDNTPKDNNRKDLENNNVIEHVLKGLDDIKHGRFSTESITEIDGELVLLVKERQNEEREEVTLDDL